MYCFFSAGPGLLLALPVLAALVVYIARQRRSSNHAISTPDIEALPEKEPVVTAVELVAEKSEGVLHAGKWVPPNHFDGNPWLVRILAEADASKAELHPVLQEFQATIEDDPILFMLFTRMFHEVPQAQDPTGRPQVKDYKHMLKAFNVVLSMGPPWAYTTAGEKGAIGAPITAIINWPMGTKAGREAFQNEKVNQQIKNTLTAWGTFLTTSASAGVLSAKSGGWLCKDALDTMVEVATTHTSHTSHPKRAFEHFFVCDPSKHNMGFMSWDDFFTRRFTPHVRPTPTPRNGEPLIVSACESAPYRIATDVAARAKFWLKAQPYSLIDMLNNSPYHHRFVGGTVYQAYLSALAYHRWHAPVSGTVVKIEHIPGTYFAENYREPIDPTDPVGPLGAVLRQSQGYISEVAARMVMYIQADDPRIGLVCAIMVGMVEVSSCESTVGEGQHVDAGEEVGMFHYGGSSYCLLFESGKKVEFVGAAKKFSGGKNIAVNSRLATIVD
ncbi:hypothetical protein LTR85_010207 [Meristemomyces frigidus]|nr:hypothetical protein LTR85_010207 [Meristemomyces frigidus]